MYKVAITSEFFGRFSDAAYKVLDQAGLEVIRNPYDKEPNEEEIIAMASEADALICDLEKITKRVIDAVPNLKIIARRGVGVDSVDCAYAESKNIEVARTLGVVETPVADLVLNYILNAARATAMMSDAMHEKKWEKVLGRNVNALTLGVVGLGAIGKEVVKRANAFGMQINYTDLFAWEEGEEKYGMKKMALEELLASSDVITLHTPLNEGTRGLINKDTLSKMKSDAVLINTARGAIIDEMALYEALKNNVIRHAYIDVFEVEPNTTTPLNTLVNCTLTPHVGTFTRETFIAMDVKAAENVVVKLKG